MNASDLIDTIASSFGVGNHRVHRAWKTSQVARFFGVTPATVRRWAADGKLASSYAQGNIRILYTIDEVVRLYNDLEAAGKEPAGILPERDILCSDWSAHKAAEFPPKF